MVAAVVCTVAIFCKRAPIVFDPVKLDTAYVKISCGVNVADPVTLSIGTPYRTLDADGTDIEPENSFDPPYRLPLRTLF